MIKEYVTKMMEKGRFLSIVEDGKAVLLAFFSVCDEPKPYLENLDHKFIEQNAEGNTVVIEEMTCKKFQKRYAHKLHDMLCEKYPNLKRGVWRRRRGPGNKDKIYTLWRRHEVQHTS